MNVKTAILIFANSSALDMQRKKISKGEQLFDFLNASIVEKAKQTRLNYHIITEKEQEGSTFGERYINIVSAYFKKGYENIITIGNDTPQLTSKAISKASEDLEHGKISIGPSNDGGFYLLAINKTHFRSEIFTAFSWQTPKLLSEIEKYFYEEKFLYKKLKNLLDIDTYKDLFSIQNFISTLSRKLIKIISLVINFSKSDYNYYFKFYQFDKGITPYNKGQPYLV